MERMCYSDQQYVSTDGLKTYAKQILRDQFLHKLNSVLANTSRGESYLSFKSHFIIEPYLLRLKPIHKMFITKLRLSNVKFPIETVRWRNIPIANRLRSKCTTGMIGEEFHSLFICQWKEVVEIRNKFISNYYINNPNENKIIGLFNLCHTELITSVSLFIRKNSVLF